MPVEFELDVRRRIVRSRGWGIVSERDLLEHTNEMRRLFAEGTIDNTWSQLAKFEAATEFSMLSTEGIRRIAWANPWPPNVRRVFIAPDLVAFGLTRMYQSLAGDSAVQLKVVSTEEQAMRVLADASRDASEK